MKEGPELIFGLVGAVGTDLEAVSNTLKDKLKKVDYTPEIIRLSLILKEIEGLGCEDESKFEEKRIDQFMNGGDNLRQKINDGSALSILSIASIRDSRKKETGYEERPIQRHAYILRSLKHKDEVEKLRKIYGKNFWLISAYSPRDLRQKNLKKRIAKTHESEDTAKFSKDALRLIERDEFETDVPFGQNVRFTFPEADVFIDTTNEEELKKSISRFVELIFGNTFHTPNKDEYGMFQAYASSLRSSSLSRQVGAAITNSTGSIIAVGTNEVPKFSGGMYWPEDQNDMREHKKGFDFNDQKKRDVLQDIIVRLIRTHWITGEKINYEKINYEKIEESVGELLAEALQSPILRNIELMNLTEFGREVHAEMAALLDAARNTISVEKCIMYCTTFPCHVCAKHIVAAGITKVWYVEPYPKSLALDMFADSITLDHKKTNKVHFRSFVGVAPRRFMDLFLMLTRKDESGKKLDWKEKNAMPRYSEYETYLEAEVIEIRALISRLQKADLKWKKATS